MKPGKDCFSMFEFSCSVWTELRLRLNSKYRMFLMCGAMLGKDLETWKVLHGLSIRIGNLMLKIRMIAEVKR